MGEVIGGPAVVNAGCRQCQGAEVKIGADGKPSLDTWPNTGIGRINPDGSLGSCSACHARHSFSRAQARTPDTCGKCHVGPDHPQIEIYNESKHGIVYRAKVDKMNLEADAWVSGIDYTAAPTCATCHMGAAPGLPKTHDVGERISWTLRPPISTKINLVRTDDGDEIDVPEGKPLRKVGDDLKGKKVVEVIGWEQRRDSMKTVCSSCHSPEMVEGHYKQFDDVVDLYNDKFAKPVAAIMEQLKKEGYITPAPFDEKIEWTWWEIWHHEGRRARHGGSMSGPDYTWRNGIYDVAKNTYFEWIPQMRDVVRKKDGNEKRADELLAQYFKPIEGHDWYFNGLSKDQIDKVRKGFEERYGAGALKEAPHSPRAGPPARVGFPLPARQRLSASGIRGSPRVCRVDCAPGWQAQPKPPLVVWIAGPCRNSRPLAVSPGRLHSGRVDSTIATAGGPTCPTRRSSR